MVQVAEGARSIRVSRLHMFLPMLTHITNFHAYRIQSNGTHIGQVAGVVHSIRALCLHVFLTMLMQISNLLYPHARWDLVVVEHCDVQCNPV